MCLETIETVGWLAYLSADGSTIYVIVHEGFAVCQFGHLVLIMADAAAYLPLEIAEGKQFDVGIDVEALVLKFATVAPVLVESGEIAQ